VFYCESLRTRHVPGTPRYLFVLSFVLFLENYLKRPSDQSLGLAMFQYQFFIGTNFVMIQKVSFFCLFSSSFCMLRHYNIPGDLCCLVLTRAGTRRNCVSLL
jgi:hypothetical protein